VIDVGPGDAPAVLFLHGFAADASCWRPASEALDRRRRVLAVDLPGHGEERAVTSTDCTSERAVERLASIMEFLGVSQTTLVGYSMGGRLALAFALAHPQRVDALVLVSASAGLQDPSLRASRVRDDESLATMIETEGIEAFVESWQRLPLFGGLERGPAERRKAVRRMRLRCSPRGLAASLRGMGTGAQPYFGERLGELQMPALLMAGARDRKFVETAEWMHERIAGSHLAVVENAGHVVHVEQPERFLQILLTFLDDEPARTQAGAA